MRATKASSIVAALVLWALPAGALLPAGSLRPAARVVDADDRTLDLRSINGRPILVIYEDKDSAKTNDALKADLSRLAEGDRYRTVIALVPVADVQSFDFWPVRGFVKDSVRSESKKIGTTIYLDWDGAFQRAAGFKRGTSSVMLVGRGARVLFSSEGPLSAAHRARLIALLRSEVDAPEGS
ncbi:MAG: hypothetical protein NVS3B10_25030 [Polyangiales bacterium]